LIAEDSNTDLKRRIEKDLSKFFYAETRRRPMIIVFFTET